MEDAPESISQKPRKTLIEAVREKYSPHEQESEETMVKIFIPKRNPASANCTPGNIRVPTELCLEDCGITSVGDKDEVSSLCKHITFLDLADNHITDWSEIYTLLDTAPRCGFLSLRHNPMNPTVPLPSDKKEYPKLQELVLHRTLLPWESLVNVLTVFTGLRELHLCVNEYCSIDLPPDFVYLPLKTLRFNGNKITTWNDCNKLSKAFPNLENLLVMYNPIVSLSNDSTDASFEHLKSLNLTHTLVSGWSELEKLRQLPALSELRIQEVPFLQDFPEELVRKFILAYLPNIERLNGGMVQEPERDEAERAFLRYEPEGHIESHRQSARFLELEAKHGKLEPLPTVDLHLKDKVLVTFICGQQVFEMEVETRWTVSELKLNLQPRLRIPWNQMRLWHEESDGHTTTLEELSAVALPVSRYGINNDGHEIMVDKI